MTSGEMILLNTENYHLKCYLPSYYQWGTPYYYNGDEIGMVNAKFNKIDDYRDIETLAEYEK
jgi:hypothetical protein